MKKPVLNYFVKIFSKTRSKLVLDKWRITAVCSAFGIIFFFQNCGSSSSDVQSPSIQSGANSAPAAAHPSTTPNPTSTPCPSFLLPVSSGAVSQGPSTIWVCNQNCGNTFFNEIRLRRSVPTSGSPNGWIIGMTETVRGNVSSNQHDYLLADGTNESFFSMATLQFVTYGSSGTTTNYSVAFGCGSLNINGARFVFSGEADGY